MEPSSSTSSGFLNATLDKGLEILSHVPPIIIAHAITDIAVIGIGGYVAYRVADYRAKKNLREGHFDNYRLNMYTKKFQPTGLANPETGEELFDQEVTVIGDITLKQLFDDKTVNTPILEALKKARKASSVDNPIVYLQLPEIVGEKDWPCMKRAMTKMAVRNLSKVFNNATNGLVSPENERLRPVRDVVLPLIVLEDSAEGPEERLLLLHYPQGKKPVLPKIENVRFEDPQGESILRDYKQDPSSTQSNHHISLSRVLEALEDPKNSWLLDFSIDFPTGRWEGIPLPEPSKEAA